ncbi:MAG: fructosamine kinase family protein [Levilactobacillus sp.]|jgi:fructosamine-3-kinase|uniref:fructosamine kinase family protein n=1 Tax=Levilactobacillus sp. TaxID=2767919 RepID=UPI00258A2D63|nr:fructosamine kinase family protein [Levilactobacillus sp.]MCH4123264.1 fructosamine kinase family protein [Levilactobacillus sp.]MCI1552598.1 fructosamine kinase family protein [Levilactobacillus sp.]MCI1606530.1 fructosamine kinase family protein [Levilactobacillus sp.]
MTLSADWLAQLPLPQVTAATPVSGGDINLAYRLTTAEGPAFLLVQPHTPASFYSHEVAGLKALGQAVNVPDVLATGNIDGDAYLVLEFLETGHGSQYELGQAVARVHRITAPQFGFDQDNLVGKLPKHNAWQDDWTTFYLNQRLDPLVKRAQEHHLWNANRQAAYDRVRQHIVTENTGRKIVPSLLHGDLWSGNYLFTADGTPTLIDPDVLYGDREFDIAMTTIFGGFTADFYRGYQDAYPFDPGYTDRLAHYQLYYLLAHLNLFGETYGGAVDEVLSRG